MSTNALKKSTFVALLSILLMLVILGSATFAWFSNNSNVGTNTATGKSGTTSLKLLIGGDEGSLTETTNDAVEITQVNTVELDKLYPVSTANLENFYYATVFDKDGNAVKFVEDENESKYYHGKLYLKMEGDNIPADATYQLYLDSAESAGGVLGQSSDGYLLNASRLGLKFNGGDPIILRFAENGKGDYKVNTMINGQLINEGDVLSDANSTVSDPSEDFSVYQLDSENITELPEKALATLKINEVAELDIYFYLEGCDEDCLGSISTNQCELHLAFYAIANQQ